MALASIGDGVICTDTQGRITFLNAIAERLTGWKQDEAVGRPLTEVFHIVNEHTRLPVENPALRALREGVAVGLANHTVLIARDGSERPIDDSAAPIRDDDQAPVGAVLVFRDVTERRRTEQAQALLAAIVESSDDAIVSKSLDGTIRSWNAGAERIFGYAPGEAVGRHITLIIPPERVGEEDAILARLRRGERVDHFETVRLAKSGRLVDVSLTISPVRNRDGVVVGASKIARDITPRKRDEERLARLYAELREQDRRKDEFLALLAHELRNPLAPLRNGLQVLRLAGQNAALAVQARDMMERQLSHMVRLIDDLLDVSRITRGKMLLRRERVSLADVVKAAVETARPLLDAGGHELDISLPPSPVYLDADLTRLAQVFANLLTNSAKYTRPGGRVWLSGQVQGGRVEVSVRDTGIGIPIDALPRIFDMFSQVERGIERTTGGLGIGLAIVKGLTEMHGGTVAAQSDGEGQGSTFTVTLPSLEAQAGSEADLRGEAPPGPPQRPPAAGHRILVVDDNPDGGDSLAMMLRLQGHEVRTARDGLEAVEEARSFRPEVVLMDVGMPRLNGLDATRQIREQPWGKGAIIVAVTGWGQPGDRERSREAGCDGHLVKPVSALDLQQLLAELAPGKFSG